MPARDKYEFAPPLERAAVALAVSDTRFYASVGIFMDPNCFPSEEAQLIMKARKDCWRMSKGAPCSDAIIAQRFRVLREDGKLKKSEGNEALDYLEECLSSKHREKEGIKTEVIEVLKERMRDEAIDKALKLQPSRKSMQPVIQLLTRAERLGEFKAPKTLGSKDTDILKRISTGKQDRLPTGIPELDEFLGGGTKRKEMGFFLGGTGDGKSMGLTQVAGSAVYERRNTAVFTLEIDEIRWGARFLSAISDVPVQNILDADYNEEQEAAINRAKKLADWEIVKMEADVTTAADIWETFDAMNEERAARGEAPFEVLIIDYADRLGYDAKLGAYEGMKHEYEAIRLGGEERNIWTWTASAAKAIGDTSKLRKRKHVGGEEDVVIRGAESAADSQHKSRVADVVITLNTTTNKKKIKVGVAKNRNGDTGFVSALMDTEYQYGRITSARWTSFRAANENDGEDNHGFSTAAFDWA